MTATAHDLFALLKEALPPNARVLSNDDDVRPLTVEAPGLGVVRIYAWPITASGPSRPAGEHKVELRLPDQQPGARATLGETAARTLVVGYHRASDVIVAWEARHYLAFPYNRNVQIQGETIKRVKKNRQAVVVAPTRKLRSGPEAPVVMARERLGDLIRATILADERELTGERRGQQIRATLLSPPPKAARPVTNGATPPVATVRDASRIGIRPRVGMYGAFARLNYTPWHAIAELVDNALQSYLTATAGRTVPPLQVKVRIEDDVLTVTDNAYGIALDDFERAFSPAERPPNDQGLSEFGIGLKAAASWFAKKWGVRTKAQGDTVERTIHFDVAKIVAEGVEELEVTSKTLRADKVDAHYTEVRLEGLSIRLRGRTIGKIRQHLASIYRQFLRQGVLQLSVDTDASSETLVYAEPEVLHAVHFREPDGAKVEWKKSIDVDLGDGKRVFGWAALLAKGDTSLAGLAILRRNRVIQGSHDTPYRPRAIYGSDNKYAAQRLWGELHVEGFTVSHTKDGIQWGTVEDDVIEALRAQMNEEPLPLIRQAENHRARKPTGTVPDEYGVDAIRSTGRSLQRHAPPVIESQIASPPVVAPPPTDLPKAPRTSTFPAAPLEISHGRRRWNIVFETVHDPAGDLYSLAHGPATGGVSETVTIRVNFGHPFAESFLNDDEATVAPVTRIFAAFAIAEITAKDAGVRQTGTLRRNANQLLREALSLTENDKDEV